MVRRDPGPLYLACAVVVVVPVALHLARDDGPSAGPFVLLGLGQVSFIDLASGLAASLVVWSVGAIAVLVGLAALDLVTRRGHAGASGADRRGDLRRTYALKWVALRPAAAAHHVSAGWLTVR